MVKQYPHQLRFIAPLTGSEPMLDESGYWITPIAEPGEFVFQPCRAEANELGRIVTSADGQELHYGWNVFTPLSCPDIPVGTEVHIFNEANQVIATGKAKRFLRQQLNVRLWL